MKNEPLLHQDGFGHSVVALGNDQMLIGATGAEPAGAVYLFSFAPLLSIAPDPQFSTITLSWSAPAEGLMLEHINALPSAPTASWSVVQLPYQTNGSCFSVTVTNAPRAGNQFFRLHKP